MAVRFRPSFKEDIGKKIAVTDYLAREKSYLDRMGTYRAIRRTLNSVGLSTKEGRRHGVAVHSLRKSFKTMMRLLAIMLII